MRDVPNKCQQQTDGRATTTMNQEVPETPPVETRELGATNAPGTPDIKSMPRRQDEHADTSTGETIEHAMDSWPKESPKKPTMGKAGDREPAKASEHALPTISTNEEFFMGMNMLLDKYMKGTIQKIDENIATSIIMSRDSTTKAVHESTRGSLGLELH